MYYIYWKQIQDGMENDVTPHSLLYMPSGLTDTLDNCLLCIRESCLKFLKTIFFSENFSGQILHLAGVTVWKRPNNQGKLFSSNTFLNNCPYFRANWLISKYRYSKMLRFKCRPQTSNALAPHCTHLWSFVLDCMLLYYLRWSINPYNKRTSSLVGGPHLLL